jgi:hypothetical protein
MDLNLQRERGAKSGEDIFKDAGGGVASANLMALSKC